MQLLDAVRHRCSTAAITDEAPGDAELASLLALAAHAPDHASLRAWRLVTIRGQARAMLGAALVAGFGDQPGSSAAAKTASKPLRAPLLIAIIAAPVVHPKVPEWEQIAATVAMVTTLELVLFDAGWTAFWRSGPACVLPQVQTVLGVQSGELLLGWLYVGGTASQDDGAEMGRPRGSDPDVSGKITALMADPSAAV